MESITAFAASIDNPLLKAIGLVLDDSLVYAAIVLALLFLGEWRNEKRAKIIACLILVFVMVNGIKYVLAHERPCAGAEWCPTGYSFPSTHAAIAFALMTGFLNKRSYAFYLLFALFVSFTRMNLGVHIFTDIAGALPVALIAYYFTDIVWTEMEARKGKDRVEEVKKTPKAPKNPMHGTQNPKLETQNPKHKTGSGAPDISGGAVRGA